MTYSGRSAAGGAAAAAAAAALLLGGAGGAAAQPSSSPRPQQISSAQLQAHLTEAVAQERLAAACLPACAGQIV
ncbi:MULTISPECIES: hypothetical protein [unclassified Streptomyces]|uniref:hypothetical protein n=1 Tax=unclassified Streptomyces TaxID=2593676 RepID=UPI0006AFD845|nr:MULTISPECIES: hypothetical protein [unclassified Streptomyces]KOX19834.1 hypothetical protein ADL06_28230 [Streptomyces sp. NRRL F-6491]KOX37951.1 hypothetical protein ADL08_28125 [Streptomyces sp. NRRL F-6492]